MKKILFFISFLGLVACDTYTVKNNMSEGIKAGDVEVMPGECADFIDSFFGIFGDFPITIVRDSVTSAKAEGGGEGEIEREEYEDEYLAGNYIVNADASVLESDESCDSNEEKETPAEGTPVDEGTPPAEEAPVEGNSEKTPAEGTPLTDQETGGTPAVEQQPAPAPDASSVPPTS